MKNYTDKSLVALIVGPVVGILVAKGYVAPQNADSLVQAIDAFMGSLITIITILGFFQHHTEVQKAQNLSNTPPQTIPPISTTTTVEVPPMNNGTPPLAAKI